MLCLGHAKFDRLGSLDWYPSGGISSYLRIVPWGIEASNLQRTK